MSYYDDIRSALEVHLAGTTGLPPVAWENVNFNPTTGTGYIKVRFIPTSRLPAVRGLNPQHRFQGVFQILVCFPDGEGPGNAQNVVDSLIDRFQTSTDLSYTNELSQTVYVTVDHAEQMGAYNQSPWYITPVNIHWFCYK